MPNNAPKVYDHETDRTNSNVVFLPVDREEPADSAGIRVIGPEIKLVSSILDTELSPRTKGLLQLFREHPAVTAVLMSVTLAAGIMAYSDSGNRFSTKKVTVKSGDTISGLVKETDPHATPAEVESEVVRIEATENNGSGYIFPRQTFRIRTGLH